MALTYPQEHLRLEDLSERLAQEIYLALAKKFYPELDPQGTTIYFDGKDRSGVVFLGGTSIYVFERVLINKITATGVGEERGGHANPFITRVNGACRHGPSANYKTFLVNANTREARFNPQAWWGVATALEEDLRQIRHLEGVTTVVESFGLCMGPVDHTHPGFVV